MNEISDGFSDLSVGNHLNTPKPGRRGNIIKFDGQTTQQTVDEHKESSDSHEPEIIVHRTGDTIDRIEFICPCGQRSEIRLDYDRD